MSSEYLRKTVADRRTGANLIGINVDTSNMTGMDNVYLDAVVQLEKFAKQSDELKIQNEKNKIALENEKQMIEFEQKYLKDPSIYTDQSKWDNVCKLWNEEIKNQKKRVADSIYLTKDEKILYSKKLDNSFAQAWTAPLTKRNEAELRARVDEATQLIETAVFNASQSGLYRIDTIDNFMRTGEEILNPLVSQGGITEQDKFSVLMSSVAKIDASIFNRNFESQILYNSNLTTEEKKAKISEIKSMMNDKRVNEIADSFAKHYKINDGQKEYLKYKLKEQYQKSEIKLDKQLYNLDKTQKRLENQAKRAISQENNVRAAINANDTFKLTKLKTGTPYNTVNMLSDDKNIDTLYGDTIENLGRTDDWRIARVLDKTTLGEIRDIKDELDKTNPDKDLNYITAIYRKADELSNGDMEIRNLVIKDASRQLGLDPNITLEYQNNPQILKTAQILKKGKMLDFGFAEGTDLEKGIRTLFDRKSEENYLALFNELGGDEKAYEVLNSYISGYIVTEANEYNRTLEKLPASAFQSILKDKVMFSKIKDDINNVKKLKIYPIQYSYAPIKIENYGINELIFDENIKETETSEEFEDYMFDF